MISYRRIAGGSLILFSWLCFTGFGFSFHKPFRRIGTFEHVEKNGVSNSFNHGRKGEWGLLMARTQIAKSWFPPRKIYDDDIFAQDDDIEDLEKRSIDLMAFLITQRLEELKDPDLVQPLAKNSRARRLASGRFRDLTCSKEGEETLERLFDNPFASKQDDEVILGAIIALQSLLMMGTQVGVKGPPRQLSNMVRHLFRREEDLLNGELAQRDMEVWDDESIRRLKFRVDQTAGTQLLSRMMWKKSTQGAFDLLVSIGAWRKHEDIWLIRSGFPTRFTQQEEEVANEAICSNRDPDDILGLRQDLTYLKTYTIDDPSTTEIDDALSVELLEGEDGSQRKRIWVHISDAERLAPPGSKLFEIARKRTISLYLPSESLPMFPQSVFDLMSLQANQNVSALSFAVELLPDGSIDSSSITVTPSWIKVDYRLSYTEVDDMLDEGVGFNEEWQLGALLEAAKLRRKHRIENGSTEGMIPYPIPQTVVTTVPCQDEPDGIGIRIKLEPSNNCGLNQTAVSGAAAEVNGVVLSSASLLVTEMMIMAGEGLGKWKQQYDSEDEANSGNLQPNGVRLPFRTQPKPDFSQQDRELRIASDLREGMQGGGYCHAWYARRFFQPVHVRETAGPHFGLGLDCYVQWSSPIRRFSDLQVHASVKRYLRRRKLHELIQKSLPIPDDLEENDIGCPVPILSQESLQSVSRDDDIDFSDGAAMIRHSRTLQKKTYDYWIFEYLRRQTEVETDVAFDAVVLGCVNPEKQQYAVYMQEIGLEHRYLSEVGALRPGMRLSLKVASVSPRLGLLTLTLNNP